MVLLLRVGDPEGSSAYIFFCRTPKVEVKKKIINISHIVMFNVQYMQQINTEKYLRKYGRSLFGEVLKNWSSFDPDWGLP